MTKNIKAKSQAMETVEVELVFGPENPDSESDAHSDSESTNKPNVPPKATTCPAAEAVKKPVAPAPLKATTRPAVEAAKTPVAPTPPKATTPTAAKKKLEESASMREEAYVPKGQGRQWKRRLQKEES
jgi:hypothetical protein